MEGYKYEANEKGHIVPKITPDNDSIGIVQRCAKEMAEEVDRIV